MKVEYRIFKSYQIDGFTEKVADMYDTFSTTEMYELATLLHKEHFLFTGNIRYVNCKDAETDKTLNTKIFFELEFKLPIEQIRFINKFPFIKKIPIVNPFKMFILETHIIEVKTYEESVEYQCESLKRIL